MSVQWILSDDNDVVVEEHHVAFQHPLQHIEVHYGKKGLVCLVGHDAKATSQRLTLSEEKVARIVKYHSSKGFETALVEVETGAHLKLFEVHSGLPEFKFKEATGAKSIFGFVAGKAGNGRLHTLGLITRDKIPAWVHPTYYANIFVGATSFLLLLIFMGRKMVKPE